MNRWQRLLDVSNQVDAFDLVGIRGFNRLLAELDSAEGDCDLEDNRDAEEDDPLESNLGWTASLENGQHVAAIGAFGKDDCEIEY